MEAIGNNIIIKPVKAVTETTKGGLMLTEKNKENIRYTSAVVIAAGDQVSLVLKAGDRIKYDKHAGHGIEVDGKSYTVIKIGDVVIKE
jgi:co-chaperonin GroES (HSP10)